MSCKLLIKKTRIISFVLELIVCKRGINKKCSKTVGKSDYTEVNGPSVTKKMNLFEEDAFNLMPY